jgi:hypothetical protein
VDLERSRSELPGVTTPGLWHRYLFQSCCLPSLPLHVLQSGPRSVLQLSPEFILQRPECGVWGLNQALRGEESSDEDEQGRSVNGGAAALLSHNEEQQQLLDEFRKVRPADPLSCLPIHKILC